MDSTESRHETNALVAATLEQDLPAMEEVYETKRASQRRAEIERAIDNTGHSRLRHWITIAVWEGEDGSTETEVVHDGHASDLELKGYLHDAIWKSVHLT